MARAQYSSHPTPKVVSSGSVSNPKGLPKPRPQAAVPTTRRIGPSGTNKNG